MALLGYARVSTSHQKLTSQITELKTAGVRDDRVFTDMMSGATDERAGLQRLLARAEKDDIILCTKMDRLGRNTADMIRIVDTCYKKGIAIRFLENGLSGLAPIFPYTFYHLTHDWFVAADIPVANDTPVHYADAIRCNVRRPPQGSLPLLTRRVSA